MVGLNGLEPATSRLSGVRSNQLSYRPVFLNLILMKNLYKVFQNQTEQNRVESKFEGYYPF